MTNRRRYPRLEVHQQVRVATPNRGEWFPASVVNCSDTGLCLHATCELTAGEEVLVDWQSGYFVGLIRNCLRAGQVWRVGIELESLNAHQVLLPDLKATGT